MGVRVRRRGRGGAGAAPPRDVPCVGLVLPNADERSPLVSLSPQPPSPHPAEP
eukprot:gene17534-4388_t